MPTDLAWKNIAARMNTHDMFLLQDYEVKLQEIEALQEEKKVREREIITH